MKLRSLKVEQLRQFRQPFLLDNLQPGLNLIHGPNESGKSTLVRAIRAAFFERYRSQAVDDLRPWGDSAAAPTIELAFEHQGRQWRLIKSFLKRTRCNLVVGTEAWSEDEAEEKLAELLGYQYPKRGASKAEFWGIPGLLWVEQGTGQDLEQAVEHAGDHLKSALNALVGEVASSGGDAVIEAVKSRRDTLLTATGQPRGDYKALQQEQVELQAQVKALDERVQRYQEQVDRLSRLVQEFEQAEQDKPWEAAAQQLEQAREQLTRAEQLEHQQEQDRGTLARLVQHQDLLEQALAQLQRLDEQKAARQAELERLRQQLRQAEQHTAAVTSAVEKARSDYDKADAQLKLARRLETRHRLENDLRQLDLRARTVSDNLRQAQQYQSQLDAARAQLRANQIDSRAVADLRRTALELNEQTIRSGAVATRLRWQLEVAGAMQLDGQALDGAGEKQLFDVTRVEIPGAGMLEITPGGDELASTRRKLEQLTQSRDDQLRVLGVDSVEEAERRASACEQAGQQVAHAEALLRSVAADGVASLQQAAEELRAEQQQLTEKLRSEPEPDHAEDIPDVATADAALAAASGQLASAEAREREHQARLLSGRQACDTAEAEWQRLEQEAGSTGHQARLDKHQSDLAGLVRQRSRLEHDIAHREQVLREARPDILRQDIERFERTITHLRQAQGERDRDIRDIRVRLDAWGAEGLEEQLNEKRGELEQCQRRLGELDRRAGALTLLSDLLTDKRQALTRKLQAPLQGHLSHYLSLLFPGATLEVDDHLKPGTFSRGSELASLAELSFGAREQMGLISRLAYADLLQEAGRPTLVILDDTLVHSDQRRLDDMKRILFDAARRHQILLFTCHPEKWQDLGVPPVDLVALKG